MRGLPKKVAARTKPLGRHPDDSRAAQPSNSDRRDVAMKLHGGRKAPVQTPYDARES